MAYTNVWNNTLPNGSEAANTIANIFRSVKTDIQERFIDIFGMPNFTDDPLRPYGIKFTDADDAVLNLGDNLGTPRQLLIKNKNNSATYFTFMATGLQSSGTVSTQNNFAFLTNNTTLVGKTTGSVAVNLLRLTNDSNNITRFISGVDAGGFQWTTQNELTEWMNLRAGVLTIASGLTVSSGTSAVQAITSTSITATNSIVAGASFAFAWNSRSALWSDADGYIRLTNNAANSFNLLQFGGVTASYPALARNGNGLSLVLADNSAYSNLSTGIINLTTAQSGSGAYLNIGDGTAMQPTFGFATPGNIIGINSAQTLSASSGVYLHGHFLTKQTVATTGTIQGLEVWTWASHATGNVTGLYGFVGNVTSSGAGTVTNIFSQIGGGVISGGSVVTNFYAIRGGGVTVDGVGSSITNLFCLHATHPTLQNSGAIGTVYGLYVDNQTGGSTANYAIFCAGSNDIVFNGSGSNVATNATLGFVYMPCMSGNPTGTPVNTGTGRVPMVVDISNHRLYVYVSGSWLQVGLT